MILYEKKTIEIEDHKVVGMICDKCKKKFCWADEGFIEMQESYRITFTGGYGSVFGDGATIECDLCQSCLKALIGDVCRVVGEDQ
jgi:hypothetical protein